MTYTVAVRTLCEFTSKAGDLDLRFTPSATALEGRTGQATVVARRGPGYQTEVALAGDCEGLHVRGRADGVDVELGVLEEIKTFRGDLARMPANRRALHWAQVKVYGALLCRQQGLPEVTLALVYFDVTSQTETVLRERHLAAALDAFFVDCCRRFLAWSVTEAAHRTARDTGLAALAFPHADFRPGQRPLAEAVWRAARAGRCLLAQAPTGIGKTVGTLYPLLRATPAQRLDKVFFLSAKTPGRAVALQALDRITAAAGSSAALRVLELVARDKACEHPDRACHGASCPLASGFYDRLPAARAEVVDSGAMTRERLRQVALGHRVCPYYLGQEMVRWADVVVGDYNHWFDSHAMLHGMAQQAEWRVGVLVDEAHNLLPRARAMYSGELDSAALAALVPLAPTSVRASIARLQHAWGALLPPDAPPYRVVPELPPPLVGAVQAFCSAVSEHQAALPEDELPPPLLRFWFDALQFARLCESFADHSLLDVTRHDDPATPGRSTLCLRNLVPAEFLKPRFASAHTTTLFSATLAPMQFHADLLGLPDDAARVEVDSPFHAAQLEVTVHTGIPTAFAEREGSLGAIAEVIAAQYRAAPGNYLAFFSSFDYLRRAEARFQALHPSVPVWAQLPQMDEAARAAFLARFTETGRGIGFAVLGGAFGEGIDLAGARLIGAFIATLGLPQVNPVNEALKAVLQARFGRGHDYAYLFPGLQRVVQAAGRVIRTPEDRGSVHLIDARFDRPEVRRLLPAWWALPPPTRRPALQINRATWVNAPDFLPKTKASVASSLPHEEAR